MPRPDLEAIKERAEKATPGPWAAVTTGGGKWRVDYDLKAQGKHWDQDDEAFRNGGWLPLDMTNNENVRLFVAARHDIPALLAYIEELEATLAEASDSMITRIESMAPVSKAKPSDPPAE